MAKFWENLKYHEDTVEKRPITSEEIQFLIDLQKEMNTQDDLGQADPRYWVIRDHQRVYGEKLNNPDGYEIYYDCSKVLDIKCDFFGREDVVEQVKKYCTEECGIDAWQFEDVFDVDDLIDLLDNFDMSIAEYEIVPMYSGMFLTQKTAEEHLRKNYYHYDDNATTYAVTAWRNKEADMLYKILHEVDFSKLKRDG